MNRWYKNNITKGILIVLEHILAVAAVVGVIWLMAAPALMGDLFSGRPAEEYKDSSAFSEQVQSASVGILNGIAYSRSFETEGKYDAGRIVDIKEFNDSLIISNENKNGLAYRLKDLEKWGDKSFVTEHNSVEANGQERAESDERAIVCKRTDGTYQYYYYQDFAELIQNGKLKFVIADDTSQSGGMSSDDILADLKTGGMYEGDLESKFKGLQNADGKMEYLDCWNYDGIWIEEAYAPVGADNLLDIVNNIPEWNGKLNEACMMINTAAESISNMLEQYRAFQESWKEGDTNLVYLYVDKNNKHIYTNREEYRDYDSIEEYTDQVSKMGRYVIVRPKLSDFQTDMSNISASAWRDIVKAHGIEEKDFVYMVGVDTDYPIQDEFHTQNALYEKYGSRMQEVGILSLASAVLFIAGMIWLTVIAGRSNKDEHLHLNWFDRRKTELSAFILFLLWLIPIYLMLETGTYSVSSLRDKTITASGNSSTIVYHAIIPSTVVGGIITAYTCGMFLIGYLSLVRRIKAGTLWSNSIIRALCKFTGDLFVNMNFVWKTVMFFFGFVFIHWLTILAGGGIWVFWMFIAETAAFIYLVRLSIARQKIRKGIEHISAGEVDYKIPLTGLRGEQLMLAREVNTIGEGLDAALEESMKSERLKTDLITNVSHDIKTPLTSIINYVDLLKKENYEDPKIPRYLDVLEAKAQRLKTLTEDVVEASKVSSGNIALEYMNINLVEMIQQTSGEFEEKFHARNLKEVLNIPEEEAIIRVDGRRMWRVLENIYNNAAKYAMEGTRIYADLEITDRQVIFSLKNVSEQPLNISADELTERFIRGDISRSTEGSGLGLSIAKSLTTMQGGSFDLYLDGDLFKATITFPRIVREE